MTEAEDWEDDAFFGDIDYDQLDKSINDDQTIQSSESKESETNVNKGHVSKNNVTTNPSSESKLSMFKFESKKVNSEASVSQSSNVSKVSTLNSVSQLENNRNQSNSSQSKGKSTENETANTNEADWDDDSLFREMDYNQVDQCINYEEKRFSTEPKSCENKSNEVCKQKDLIDSNKKIKLDQAENLETSAFSGGTKLPSLFNFETNKIKNDPSIPSSSNSKSDFTFKSKPKSKLSKFI